MIARRIVEYVSRTFVILIVSFGDYGLADDRYPHEVLVGTDVVDIATYQINKEPEPGHYIAETGGAVLELSITKRGKLIDVHRVFSEPGMNSNERYYDGLTKVSDDCFKSKNVVLKFVGGGAVLLLEQASGVDAIPSELWIHYTPE